ncbi:hypothetical protein [Mariniblastus fucicola]|nr:hypothetical protein [Mariniblastus fucicola]
MVSRILIVIAMSIVVQGDSSTSPDSTEEQALASPTVGAPGVLSDIILPGGELVAKPLTGDPAMIVQVVDAIRHGDSFRYTLRFSGLEPGPYDLTEWLVRKDGEEKGELPAVLVEIKSLLPAGQITPNQLPEGWLPRMGGYKVVMIAAAGLWSLVLLALIFGGRGKKAQNVDSGPPPRSLADLLRDRLEAAFESKVAPQQYAELERMLFSWWRKRLGYESMPLDEAMVKIKANEQAGPLMRQLESWMHRPAKDHQNVDLAKLLEPYRSLPVDELEAST